MYFLGSTSSHFFSEGMVLNFAQASCHLFYVLIQLEMNMESFLYQSVLTHVTYNSVSKSV
jgi:hypothetical protein